MEPEPARHFSTWKLAVKQLCGGTPAIDQRDRLRASLKENRAFAFFPGAAFLVEASGAPCNSAYERNVFTLAPESRAVVNVVLGYSPS